ncbi:MAG: hypothetical protein FJZ78_04130 [Bacteroidetes bacterium]|nr:hypothetical protein [Bacteroidota bacterium]
MRRVPIFCWLFLIQATIYSKNLFAQPFSSGLSAPLSGIWIAEGSKYSNELKPVTDPEFGVQYLQYVFEGDQLCFGFNAYELTGCYSSVTYRNDTALVYGRPLFVLNRQSPDRIQLTRLQNGNMVVLNRMRDNQVTYARDSVYRPGPSFHPVHGSRFASNFFFNSLVIYPAPRADQKIVVDFTVMANGDVRDTQIISAHSKMRNRWFRNSLVATSGEWIPAMAEGKPVNCRIRLEILRTGYKTISASEKAYQYYQKATAQITKTKYAAAIGHLNDALVFEPTNARYLYTRAVCHFYLKDERKQCENIIKAREICPFIPTAMVDEQLGIMVECFKK